MHTIRQENKRSFTEHPCMIRHNSSISLEIEKIKTDVITTPVSIVSTIVQYAEKDNTTLIIMGTRGITGFKRILLGSVASGVVTYAHCPVLVIR